MLVDIKGPCKFVDGLQPKQLHRPTASCGGNQAMFTRDYQGQRTATQAAGGSPESLMPILPAVRPARMAPDV